MNKQKLNCSLCGNEIKKTPMGWALGNNPHPLMKNENDRCCDECNENYVLPTRVILLQLSHKPESKDWVNKKGWINNVEGTKHLVKMFYHKI